MTNTRLKRRFAQLTVVLAFAMCVCVSATGQLPKPFRGVGLSAARQGQMYADYTRFVRAATCGDARTLSRYLVAAVPIDVWKVPTLRAVGTGAVFEDQSRQRVLLGLEVESISYGTWDIGHPIDERSWLYRACATYVEGGAMSRSAVVFTCCYRRKHFVFTQLQVVTSSAGGLAPCETTR